MLSGVAVAAVTVPMGEDVLSLPVEGAALESLAVVEVVLEALPVSVPVEPEAAARVVEPEGVDRDPPPVLPLFVLLSVEELDAVPLLVFTELPPLLVLAVTLLSALDMVLAEGSASPAAALDCETDADAEVVCELAVIGGGDSKLPELADTWVLVCSV